MAIRLRSYRNLAGAGCVLAAALALSASGTPGARAATWGRISPDGYNLCAAGTGIGAAVSVDLCFGSDPYEAWTLVPDGLGSLIENENGGCIEAKNGGSSGSGVILAACDPSSYSQVWQEQAGTPHAFTDLAGGTSLDDRSTPPVPGATLKVYTVTPMDPSQEFDGP